MLNTFDENNNEMLLAAIQELTANLATAQGKIAELESGGGSGGGVGGAYRIVILGELISGGGKYPVKVENVESLKNNATNLPRFYSKITPAPGFDFYCEMFAQDILKINTTMTAEDLGVNSRYDDQGEIISIDPSTEFPNLLTFTTLATYHKAASQISTLTISKLEGSTEDYGYVLDLDSGYFLFNFKE